MAARGVPVGAKAAALLTRSNARACLMMAVAALRADCQRQRVCDASLLSLCCAGRVQAAPRRRAWQARFVVEQASVLVR